MYQRPMVPLELALFGHPEAGNIWQNHSFAQMKKLEWAEAPAFPSVFKHSETKAMMNCYVDDFNMQAKDEDSAKHWADP